MITNVVCKANLNCVVDLEALVSKTIDIIYDPATYSGVRWMHRKIGGHCNVFSTGKIMTNGKANSVKEGKRRLRRYARLIQRLGWPVTLSKIDVVTISASFTSETPLNLHKVIQCCCGKYEPELFPAAMFSKNSIHFTCFHTGVVLMTGIKREHQLYHTCMPILIELPLL